MSAKPENPGIAFLRTHRGENAEELIAAYAQYLLHESEACQIPVSLGRIIKHFRLQSYKAPLPGSRGLTTPDLDIFVNVDDTNTVQRFSVAHELMELLLIALKNEGCSWMSEVMFAKLWGAKERLCELGAAELLMPMDLFKPLVQREGVSMGTAEKLANLCRVSLTAAFRRVVDTDLAKCAVIRWRFTHSKTQFVPSKIGQLPLFGDADSMDPPKKLRVERVYVSPSVRASKTFIPREKSVDDSTLVFRAYNDGVPTAGYDDLDLARLRGRYYTENRPIKIDGEWRVLSLVYLETTMPTQA